MKSIFIFLAFLNLFFSKINAQHYSSALINDSLKAIAHSVVRDFNIEFELKSANTGTIKIIKVTGS